MARLEQRQNSNGLSDRHHLGCVGFFSQYFDGQQLLHSKKLLEESKTGDAKKPSITQGPRMYVPSSSNQPDKSHEEANLKVSKKKSGKALKDLISKKLFRKLQRRHKMLPVSPHLLRTFSIHHLECNDYVIPEEITENAVPLESLETDPSQTGKQVSYLEEGIKSEICGSMDNVKESLFKKPSASTSRECDSDGVLPNAGSEIYMLTSEPAVSNNYCPNNQMNQGTHLKRLSVLMPDNRKEIHRISMDSLLHNVPYGQKMPKDISRKNLFRSTSAGSSGDVSSDNIGILSKVYLYRRSHSLTENLDQYTDLFNSISSGESKRNLEPLSSVKKNNSLQENKTSRNFERIHSNPEFRSYHPRQDIQFRASLSLKEPSITPLDMDKRVDGFRKPDLSETAPFIRDKMEYHKYIVQNQTMNSSDRTDKNLLVEADESEVEICAFEQSETCKVTNSTEELGAYVQEDTGALEFSFFGSESEQTELSELKQKGNEFVAFQPSDEPTQQNQMLDLDLHLEEEIASPSKNVASKDSELGSLQFEECNSFPKPVNSLDVRVSSGAEIVESSSTCKQTECYINSDTFHIKLDQSDETEFNYVRDFLMKSGFDSVEFVGEWYSQFKVLDPYLFDKANGIFDEVKTATHDASDTSLDRQLLSDLINELLVEIYEKSFVHDWFLRILPNVRPFPVGDHVLEEVWMKISWLLSSQRQLIHTLEEIMARDFAKSDRWLNLQWDAVFVGMEIESLILNDLLDEFMDDLPYEFMPEIIDI